MLHPFNFGCEQFPYLHQKLGAVKGTSFLKADLKLVLKAVTFPLFGTGGISLLGSQECGPAGVFFTYIDCYCFYFYIISPLEYNNNTIVVLNNLFGKLVKLIWKSWSSLMLPVTTNWGGIVANLWKLQLLTSAKCAKSRTKSCIFKWKCFSWLIWKKKTLENEIEISELKDHFSGFEFLWELNPSVQS